MKTNQVTHGHIYGDAKCPCARCNGKNPAYAVKPAKEILSNDKALPYFAVQFVPHQRKWIRALNLIDVVSEFCASRDFGNFGASDLGGRLPLFLMSANGKTKKRVGVLCYNGNVILDHVVQS